MDITSLRALLGFVALVLLFLLTAKLIEQPTQSKAVKQTLFLLLIGLISLASCTLFFYTGMHERWPRLSNLGMGLVYWIGPSLYFYSSQLTGGPSPFVKRINLLHWSPGVLAELLLIPYYLMPAAEKMAYLEDPSGVYVVLIRGIWWVFQAQLLIYIFLCLPLLRPYRRRIIQSYCDIPEFDLRWLQLLCCGFIGQIMLAKLLPLLTDVTPRSSSGAAMMVTYLFIIALGYLALGRGQLQLAAGEQRSRPTNGKYYRSGLGDHSARYYLGKLNDLMTREQSYLESDLSLKSLADKINLSPHHLSQILNEKLQKTFYDYVNEQRVEYAKQLLVQEPQRPITSIAVAAGYNNKNSFYNAFKRHAGTGPSEYRRKNEGSSSA